MDNRYRIMERKDLGINSIVAVPENLYHKGVDAVYDFVGFVEGLTPEDFRIHRNFRLCYLPLGLIGSLAEPSRTSRESVQKGLEAIGRTREEAFDERRLLQDQELLTQILGYQVIEGDLYVARILADLRGGNRSVGFLLSAEDGELALGENGLYINGDLASFSSHDLEYMCCSEKTVEIFKAGTLRLHRKTLEPYSSRGQMGGIHSNGPWIVLEDEVEQ